MNCVELFLSQAKENPEQMALWLPDSGTTSYGELEQFAERAQKLCLGHALKPGDSVLLVDALGPRLYAAVIGVLALGCSVVLVEPWLAVKKINHVLNIVKPKIFLTSFLGKLWGLRVPAIRSISKWVNIGAIHHETLSRGLQVESVSEDTHGIITFTSGTSGNPKGIVRSQGYLVNQFNILSKTLGLDQFRGPDLCIFANFVLVNLASGRGSIILPPKWKNSIFAAIDSFPRGLRPETLACGPAFLLRLMKSARVESLKSIHVGGALSDCWIFEEGFKHWPDADWSHIYGSSEAESVAVSGARVAVKESRKRNYFQTLHLGKPIPEIRSVIEENGLWVSGPHVCPNYLGNEEENSLYKRQDEQGTFWHFMGDRIVADGVGWWYGGRSGQSNRDFQLEQSVYHFLGSSKSFVHRDTQGRILLMGEGIRPRSDEILKEFPDLAGIVEIKIYRDRRHRARIDRGLSLKKGAPWLVG